MRTGLDVFHRLEFLSFFRVSVFFPSEGGILRCCRSGLARPPSPAARALQIIVTSDLLTLLEIKGEKEPNRQKS
jgi:hypothetical protein